MAIDPKKLRNYAGVAPAPLKKIKNQAPPDDEAEGMDDEDLEAGEEDPSIEDILADAQAAMDAGEMEEEIDLASGYDPEEHGNPPSWINPEDEEIWERAKAAVEEQWDQYNAPWAVVTYVFKRMGGNIAEAE